LRQNIFGANLGGPLFIPHVFNSDRKKTFFFYNQEWRRVIQTSSPSTSTTMPNADRPTAGTDLAYTPPAYATSQTISVPSVAQVPDPAFAAKVAAAGLVAGQPFPKNAAGQQVIPHTLFDPNAVLYLSEPAGTALLPYANVLGDKATTEIATPTTVTEEIVRIDHEVNDKWKILGHFLHDAQATGVAGADLSWNWTSYDTISSVENNPSNSAAIKLTGELSPSVLFEASMNYDGNIINITNSANTLQPSGWASNVFFQNSGSNQQSGVNWGGNGVGGSVAMAMDHGTTQLKTMSQGSIFPTPAASMQ